ncbi:Rossmann-like and DUF2520 domain-containing protein [Flagellimonas lutaonensis]|uniref:DUF2520 domain-containing protein n=1 Tax=Flagellimonas lutaonensis TaxID=516051 RepID=A0A0D5YVA5_9FLAO|nr:Rossmann-like and DUF2520 domain-containing protein [Allomuricauda lutaonensis]AKA36160.1 hypothetical protein VC82_2598 [Allomuricauda lutaonensis]
MLSVIIIGSGNVAFHLFQAFNCVKHTEVVQVVARNKVALDQFAPETDRATDFGTIKNADVYLLAVSDSAIRELIPYLKTKQGVVAHTSGSVPMTVLSETESYGVFYPLQTFSKEKPVNLSEVPICIEGNNATTLSVLGKLAQSLSGNVHEITSEQRRKLHLAAVFANNFANHLFAISAAICEASHVPFDLLRPLIGETADKVRLLPPEEAQTGPATRNDIETMQRHLDELADPLHKKIYQLLSQSIRQVHEKKL